MRAQEIFDKAVSGLLEQGEQSYSEQLEKCVYRGECGNKCAVGQLIPDELYSEDMDVGPSSVISLLEKFPHLRECVLPCDMSSKDGINFLSVLQSIHDNSRERDWREAYRDMALRFGLEWNFN